MENAAFGDLLKEHMEVKGLTVKKVSEATDIPERYIETLLAGDNRNLPPAPYVRGYINKLSLLLDFDSNAMWRLYREESNLKSSGGEDKLPSNRFAIKSIKKKWLIGGMVAVFLVFYLSSNAYQVFGSPNIKITNPPTENAFWTEPMVVFRGKVESSSTLTINGAELYVAKDGSFKKEQNLQPGLNTFEFSAKRFLGKESKAIRQIIYQPKEVEAAETEVKNDQRNKQ
jgi:hypothetical protein